MASATRYNITSRVVTSNYGSSLWFACYAYVDRDHPLHCYSSEYCADVTGFNITYCDITADGLWAIAIDPAHGFCEYWDESQAESELNLLVRRLEQF